MVKKFLKNKSSIKMRTIVRILENSFLNSYNGYHQNIYRCLATGLNSEKAAVLKIAIIGAPNAGKSTVINQIIKRRVLAISKKVHTTKDCARAVFNHKNKQLVFLDTPGLISVKEFERYKLSSSFLNGGENAVIEADLIGVVHDVSQSVNRYKLDPKVLRLLYIYKNKESFLILNKIDTLKSRRSLLDISSKLTGEKISETSKEQNLGQPFSEIQLQEVIKTKYYWENFSNVFMVSALLGNGMQDLRNYLLNKTYTGEWIFPAESYTDQDPVKIIEDIVRSKLLEYLPEEIPYNLEIELEYLDMEKEDLISTVVLIHCEKERIVGLIKGVRGGRIKMIADEAEQAIADAFLSDVHLKLVITEKQSKVKNHIV